MSIEEPAHLPRVDRTIRSVSSERVPEARLDLETVVDGARHRRRLRAGPGSIRGRYGGERR